jgi:hypothetical protein
VACRRSDRSQEKGIYRVRASHELARVSVSYDEANLVSVAGLLPAAALAQKVGLAELVEARVRLSEHGANSGTKALSVVGSMLAGGDSIYDIALLRAGALPELFDQTRAPSTIGTWLRSFRWSNERELDAVTRGLLARLWAAGAGPADPAGALTVDLRSLWAPRWSSARPASTSVPRGRPVAGRAMTPGPAAWRDITQPAPEWHDLDSAPTPAGRAQQGLAPSGTCGRRRRAGS